MVTPSSHGVTCVAVWIPALFAFGYLWEGMRAARLPREAQRR